MKNLFSLIAIAQLINAEKFYYEEDLDQDLANA
jgi:hypothetical protein